MSHQFRHEWTRAEYPNTQTERTASREGKRALFPSITPRSVLEQQAIQATNQPRRLHHLARRQQRPRDIGSCPSASVMPDRQALVGQAKDRLEGDDIARQPEGMDLRTLDCRATRRSIPMNRFDGHFDMRMRHPTDLFGQLAHGPA